MRPAVFAYQCTAKSKRSGCRCKNYACRDRDTCRMHGGTSRQGAAHPNYRHGGCSKVLREVTAKLDKALRRPIEVDVLLFPRPLEEIGDRQPLRGLIVPPGQLTIREWMRALRTARRMLAEELAELRAQIAAEAVSRAPSSPRPDTNVRAQAAPSPPPKETP